MDAYGDKAYLAMLDQLSRIGRTEQGGSHRLGFSDADMQARDYFMGAMREAGMTVRMDAFGNIIGRIEGTDPTLPAVAAGSHIDTVPNGGHYDGMVGSVAALFAMGRIAKRGPTRHPMECIVFQLEESSRFALATTGSKVMAGKADLQKMRVASDAGGITLPQAMAAQGLDFELLPSAVRTKGELKAFLELHIDQSKTLEDMGLPLGVVTAIAAPIRARVVIDGVASHSGSTPMNKRFDAGVSAAAFVLAVREVGDKYAEQQIVTTVGQVVLEPGSMNVVPGKATLLVDLRGTDREVMLQAFAEVEQAMQRIGDRYKTPFRCEMLGSESPVRMDASLQKLFAEVCREKNVLAEGVVSGAGHDAMNLAEMAPVSMLFVRCKDGISHNPAEYAAPEDLLAGLDVLTETLYRLAK